MSMSMNMAPRSVAAVVLAAGGSRRLGRPKQLVEREGVPLVRHAVVEAAHAPVDAVAVVLGAAHEAVAAALGDTRVAHLLNPDWAEGLATSIHVAVRWGEARAADALLFVLCDQPRLTRAHLAALCAAHARTGRPVASGYGGTYGVPALVPAPLFSALCALTGDQGAARVLRQRPDVEVVDWPDGALDIDTEADLARL